MRSIQRILVAFATVIASLTAVTLKASAATPASGVVKPSTTAGLASPGTYRTISPTRVLDTRYGIGAPKRALARKASCMWRSPAARVFRRLVCRPWY
jgi:hypothetical protein